MQSIFQKAVSKADLSYIDVFFVLLPLLQVADMEMAALRHRPWPWPFGLHLIHKNSLPPTFTAKPASSKGNRLYASSNSTVAKKINHLHHKCISHHPETNSIVVTISSCGNLHLSSMIISLASLIYSSTG